MPLTPHQLYQILCNHFGVQQWWPIDELYHQKHSSDPRFEIMVGAILTQNTAWSNVEKVLDILKKKQVLEIKKIRDIPIDELKILIQPSGFFNQKAVRLKTLAQYIFKTYNNNIDKMFQTNISTLRSQLLSLHGIGFETADSILLYAGNKPIFVVDAYTTRLARRLPLQVAQKKYQSIQQFFEHDLSQNYTNHELVCIYQQFHALLVECAKQHCKKNPVCTSCPIKTHCSKLLL